MIFQNENVHNNATTAINLAEGIIGVKRFLHGTVLVDDVDPDNGELTKVPVKKDAYIKKYKTGAIIDGLSSSAQNSVTKIGDASLGGNNFKSINISLSPLISVSCPYESISSNIFRCSSVNISIG